MSCPVCHSTDLHDLLDVGEMPVLCNELCSTEEDAHRVRFGRIELTFCRNCGHLFNKAFDPSQVVYSPAYENSLHCSARFQGYADSLAEQLVEQYDLRGKRVVEIGCGQGDFLRSICAAGDNTGFGFDPSYQGGNEDDRVTIRPWSFSDLEGKFEADLVCCRHVLEHIHEPTEFLKALAAKLAPETPVFFEVPNGLFTLRDGGVWDIVYEHCGYFSPVSLERAFRLAGIDVERVEEAFEGQFLVVHGRVSHVETDGVLVDGSLEALATGFAEAHTDKVEQWRNKLRDQLSGGGRVVVWGAGSKGNTFLNLVGNGVLGIVDINPKKHGKFVAGAGQPIIKPEQLRDTAPSTVVIMNPAYQEEIRAHLSELGLYPEVLVA
jgi:SAM-dependent methyltransferase